jgi:hypothetical protein
LLFVFNLQASNAPFILVTVPKSGTYLAHNLVQELTGRTTEFIGKTLPWINQNPNGYAHCHLKYYFDPVMIKKIHPNFKYFINVRDPRDVCISSVYYFENTLNVLLGEDADFDTRLSYTIKQKEMRNYFGVLLHFQRVWDLINKVNPLVIKYEDLVGPQGGGTIEQQIKAIQQVGRIFNMDINKNKAIAIGERIYGHSETFRSGKTGSWRDQFTPKHIEEFKKSGLQKVLIDFGYEKDDQW